MNELEQLFYNSSQRWSTKWEHYFEIYDRHFNKFRNQEVHVVEFGVYQGGSLHMWKNYFGPRCHIYGVDINPACKDLEEDQITIFIGDQEDRSFLQNLRSKLPRIDIFIDDGGHMMNQQIVTFEEMFPPVQENGIYVCEDLHTSYWPKFGGGIHEPNTFINYSKNLIDDLHSFHLQTDSITDHSKEFCRSAHSIHFYDSVVVIEKQLRSKPKEVESGIFNKNFPSYPVSSDKKPSLLLKFKRYIKNLFFK